MFHPFPLMKISRDRNRFDVKSSERAENIESEFFFQYQYPSHCVCTMSNPRQVFDYRDEAQADRLARKAKDSPFMIIGILGLLGVCGFGAYKYKTRGKMSTSVFLMQLRVAAQGTVVSALTIGLAYTLVKDHLLKDDKKKE